MNGIEDKISTPTMATAPTTDNRSANKLQCKVVPFCSRQMKTFNTTTTTTTTTSITTDLYRGHANDSTKCKELEIMRTLLWMYNTYASANPNRLKSLNLNCSDDIADLVINGLYFIDEKNDSIILQCWYCSKRFVNWISARHLKLVHECEWTRIMNEKA